MIARVNVSLLRSWRSLALVALVLGGIAGVWRLSDRTPTSLALATLAVGGAGLVAFLSTRRPVVAFGVLFLLASLSRWTIDTQLGNMRLEQPAIAAGLLAMLYARRLPDLATWRRLLPMAVAFMVYLGALTASSLLHSPDRVDSLRMVFWIGLSMAGGLLAFLLLFGGDPEGGPHWLRLAAAPQAAAGILIALLFFWLGPVILAGGQYLPGMDNKVYGMSWEANVYASLLGAVGLFAIEESRSRPRLRSVALVALLLLGMAVGLTRGAYLGLTAGLIAYIGVILYRRQRPRSLLLPGSVAVGAIVVGLLVAPVLLDYARTPTQPIDLTTPGWGRGLAIGPYLLPGLPGHPPSGLLRMDIVPPAPPVPPGEPKPPPVAPPPTTDTIAFRLDRIPIALADWHGDPVIGLGANSFGQRHVDLTQGPAAPDHLAILAVAALYESGVVGSVGLIVGFALILLALWRASRRPTTGPMAAAYLGSLVSLLVAYQATNALNFSLIWLIAGAGLAMVFSKTADRSSAPE
ncbi:MAG: hypothetical protein ABSE70_00455 [Candidatus Limnocylindrales bacterium]